MFDLSDPRASLSTSIAGGASDDAPRRPQLFEFDKIKPIQVDGSGSRTWWVRSQNLIVSYTRARAGTVLRRSGQPDAYMALVRGADSGAGVVAACESAEMGDETLVIVDAEVSEMRIFSPCTVLRLFSTRSPDLAAMCLNASAYAALDPRVTGLSPAPAVRGAAVSRFSVQDIPKDPSRFGRIYASDALMLNYMYPEDGPRDTTRLSPHSHDDFEQVSIQLEGDYIHDLRTPWTPRLADWRPDEHIAAKSPAVLVIPPPLVHTSRWVGEGRHQLADAFAPPRSDFSEMPGWVLNARPSDPVTADNAAGGP